MDTDIVYIKTDITKMLQKMLELNLILQVMNQIDHYQKQKRKKVIGLIKDELGGKKYDKFVELRAKTLFKR